MESGTNKPISALASSASASSASSAPLALTSQHLQIWETIKQDVINLNKTKYFAAAKRKSLATEISSKLLGITPFIFKDVSLMAEYAEIAGILHQHLNAQYSVIEHYATEYFGALFRNTHREIIDKPIFTSKPDGDQLGRKMTITYVDSHDETKVHHTMVYYIKTHQHGSKSGQESVQAVDPKEILVYKLFEYLGLGPKTHFFFNLLSNGGFYIATQDTNISI